MTRFYERLDFKLSVLIVCAMFISSLFAIGLYVKESLIFLEVIDEPKQATLLQQLSKFDKTSIVSRTQLVEHFKVRLKNIALKNDENAYILIDSKFNVLANVSPIELIIEQVRSDIEPDLFAVTISSTSNYADVFTIYQRLPGLILHIDQENFWVINIPLKHELPESFIMFSVWQKFLKHLGVFAILFFVVTIVTVFMIYRNFMPLRKLEKLAEELSNNKVPQQINDVGDDEIGKLICVFNDTSKKLEKYKVQREQMTSDISHELRTPITNILGRIEAYEENIITDEKSVIRFVSEQLTGLSKIVEDMQLLNSVDAEYLTIEQMPIDITATFINWANSNSLSSNINITVKGESCIWELDETRVIQVLNNLLANASKAKPDKLNILLKVEKFSDYILIEFEDNGPGIAPEFLELIFERLYRVDESRSLKTGGSGLGLSIVRSLVEAQNGAIDAYLSEYGGLGLKIVFYAK